MEHIQQSNDILIFFGVLQSTLLAVVGFFLKETLRDLKESQKAHDETINRHETRIGVIESRIETAA